MIKNKKKKFSKTLQFFAEKAIHWHCVKSVRIRSFFWSVFSRIKTEYGKILSIQSECGKLRTR